jgi:hypothetical protein
MARYYIDVRSRFAVDEDCDGIDLPDLTTARAEAIKVGQALLERWTEMPPEAHSEIIIKVVDERLRNVLRVSLAELHHGLLAGDGS